MQAAAGVGVVPPPLWPVKEAKVDIKIVDYADIEAAEGSTKENENVRFKWVVTYLEYGAVKLFGRLRNALLVREFDEKAALDKEVQPKLTQCLLEKRILRFSNNELTWGVSKEVIAAMKLRKCSLIAFLRQGQVYIRREDSKLFEKGEKLTLGDYSEYEVCAPYLIKHVVNAKFNYIISRVPACNQPKDWEDVGLKPPSQMPAWREPKIPKNVDYSVISSLDVTVGKSPMKSLHADGYKYGPIMIDGKVRLVFVMLEMQNRGDLEYVAALHQDKKTAFIAKDLPAWIVSQELMNKKIEFNCDYIGVERNGEILLINGFQKEGGTAYGINPAEVHKAIEVAFQEVNAANQAPRQREERQEVDCTECLCVSCAALTCGVCQVSQNGSCTIL